MWNLVHNVTQDDLCGEGGVAYLWRKDRTDFYSCVKLAYALHQYCELGSKKCNMLTAWRSWLSAMHCSSSSSIHLRAERPSLLLKQWVTVNVLLKIHLCCCAITFNFLKLVRSISLSSSDHWSSNLCSRSQVHVQKCWRLHFTINCNVSIYYWTHWTPAA